MEKLTLEEWTKQGEQLFGKDKKQWKFICPSCGNIQTIQDFIDLKENGVSIDPQTAFFSCIGRFIENNKGTMFNDKSPCNYTNGGLINLSEVKVIDDEENEHYVFEFAK
jgi:hypothetical protein